MGQWGVRVNAQCRVCKTPFSLHTFGFNGMQRIYRLFKHYRNEHPEIKVYTLGVAYANEIGISPFGATGEAALGHGRSGEPATPSPVEGSGLSNQSLQVLKHPRAAPESSQFRAFASTAVPSRLKSGRQIGKKDPSALNKFPFETGAQGEPATGLQHPFETLNRGMD